MVLLHYLGMFQCWQMVGPFFFWLQDSKMFYVFREVASAQNSRFSVSYDSDWYLEIVREVGDCQETRRWKSHHPV